MAGEQIQREQNDIDEQHQRTDADAEVQLLIGARKPEGAYCVIPKEAQEDDGAIKKIAMQVLQDEREFRFAAIISMRRLAHGAARRIHEERPVISFAIVVAGDAEAQRKSQNQQRRRKMPPAKVEKWGIERR